MKNVFGTSLLFLLSGSLLHAQTVTDIDGNSYNTVVIGAQEWMQENLEVTRYSNGDAIPHITDNTLWNATTSGAYAYYYNDVLNLAEYGALYNGFVVQDSRNVCPTGWHVPTDNEWRLLFRTVCTTSDCDVIWADDNTTSGNTGTDEGGSIKETGTSHWNSPNAGATNSSGFTVLPGGYRFWDGNYYTLNEYNLFWTDTEHTTGINMWYYGAYYNLSTIYHGYGDKHMGNAIRCVRPAAGSGTSEIQLHEPVIFPNPAESGITFNNEMEFYDQLKIVSLTGQVILETALIKGVNELDIQSLSAGLYTVWISGPDFISCQKLVVE